MRLTLGQFVAFIQSFQEEAERRDSSGEVVNLAEVQREIRKQRIVSTRPKG